MIHNAETRHSPTRKIDIKKEFLEQIMSGEKTANARPLSYFDTLPIPGEEIEYFCSSGTAVVTVISVEQIPNIQEITKQEDLNKFGRGITQSNALFIWSKLYPNYQNEPIVIVNFKN